MFIFKFSMFIFKSFMFIFKFRSNTGMGTGITIVELGLFNLLYFFDWSLREGMTIKDIDMKEDGAFVIAKKVPLELVPTRHRW
ncbi:hypothetical protein Bca4012_021282 [Brassica carinata]